MSGRLWQKHPGSEVNVTGSPPGTLACHSAEFSRAYIRHLLKSGEMLGMRLAVLHNLWFYNNLMEVIRQKLNEGTFEAFYREQREILGVRI